MLGQPNLNGSLYSQLNPGGINGATLKNPYKIVQSGKRLFAVDTGNHRILIWNSLPASNQQPADVVLGQVDMNATQFNSGGLSNHTLYTPYDLAVAGNRLIVADYYNHRVLIWNAIPIANYQAADLVLGQPDMHSNDPNSGGLSAKSLYYPTAVSSDGIRLFVADYGNNRILVWNNFPSTFQQSADAILGQPDFISNKPNNGGVSLQSISHPTSVLMSNDHLFVTEEDNHRVLIWNSVPALTQKPADLVLGQSDITSRSPNVTGVNAHGLNSPSGVWFNGTQLFVSDQGNHRILVWQSLPEQNGQNADLVLGQPNMTSNSANHADAISETSLWGPKGISGDTASGMLYIADAQNNRIIRFNQNSTASANKTAYKSK